MGDLEKPQLRRIRAVMRAAPEGDDGTVEAYVSVYDVVYDIGWGWQEKILPGAFDESIAANSTLPIMWEHDWRSGPIGSAAASSDDHGVKIAGQLYLGVDPMVDRVYRAMADGAVNEWSIAFFPEVIVNDVEDRYVDQIQKGDLIEATACLRGANPDTETLDLRGRPLVSITGDAKKEVARIRSLLTPDSERIASPEAVARAWDAMASRAGRDLVRAARSSGSGRSDS